MTVFPFFFQHKIKRPFFEDQRVNRLFISFILVTNYITIQYLFKNLWRTHNTQEGLTTVWGIEATSVIFLRLCSIGICSLHNINLIIFLDKHLTISQSTRPKFFDFWLAILAESLKV